MKSEISNLESHLGYWLRFVSNHVSHSFRLKVEACGVTVAEWVVMRALYDLGAVNPSNLSDRIGLTRGAVSKLIDRLVGKGFVLCRVEKDDRRYQTVILSSAGRKLVPMLAKLADQNDREFFGDLKPHERSTMASVLRRIVENRGLKSIPTE